MQILPINDFMQHLDYQNSQKVSVGREFAFELKNDFAVLTLSH